MKRERAILSARGGVPRSRVSPYVGLRAGKRERRDTR